ncbi:hypothetical protein M0R19_05275 [Candidatus Pacearchaeota archaeon]|nr:hypothetical protein [Candidatus Pacearchaeota archaeon]
MLVYVKSKNIIQLIVGEKISELDNDDISNRTVDEVSWWQISGDCILLPDLEWLVRKLKEEKPAMGMFISFYADAPYGISYYSDDDFHDNGNKKRIEFREDDPKMACLKALCKIKGISID